jgi:pantetheine-phosphate adenylyltransferase
MMNTALFPGSFDPVTKGHEDIVLRALPLFDRIIVAIGENNEKKSLFGLAQRIQWLKECFQKENKVEVKSYKGLTVNFCREMNARYIIRGIRNSHDFLYEANIAQINRTLAPQIETVFFATAPACAAISSTMIRDIYIHHGDFKQFMPDNIIFHENL